ncbi:DNA cytosine methyltransferase [Chroococcidiopsis sp. FACHB-1243]|uniref:DNA cytosine methyltransferase n=1 Tax=Chroococcidiopsis sp. [FACHB-1243] TaxID=2692781 RepID=UPI00177AC94A|nr:DNA cytosine methyltransferase [Chroococcidiopsis sp. [FACHB-1243]]MBD2304323.1 DNA cytosine methyltransferase [Chroococcidiopsis sp. [FACHB-1243]]
MHTQLDLFNLPDIPYTTPHLQALTTPKATVIELFAGAGGLALGLEYAGLSAKALVEIDKDAVATLRHNRPNWSVIHADVSKVSFDGMSADVVTGGFPCQAFSYAGKGLGFEDIRGTLFYEFVRCVKEVKPKLFLAENVRGLISHQQGETLKTVLSVLESLDYNIQYRLLNAVNYDVPQKRERIIIIGTRPDIRFQYPAPSAKILTLRDALKNVPLSEGVKYSSKKAAILALVPPGGCWRDLPEDIQKSYMMKSYYLSGGRTGMARRIAWDEPSLTLTTSPSQKQTERCHPDETRPFTVREYARIQTFPDDWEFIGGISSKYQQIGNAVPVKFAYHLGRAIINALSNVTDQYHVSKPDRISS